jgi:hypothetical protein
MNYNYIIIGDILKKSAEIIRKYNIPYEEDYFKTLKGIQRKDLIVRNQFAYDKVKNKQIIKDASVTFTEQEETEILSRIEIFGNERNRIYTYLTNDFNVKTLKLKEENLERRVRQILAKRYLGLLLSDANRLIEIEENKAISKRFPIVGKLANFIIQHKLKLFFLLLFNLIVTPKIVDHLKPPDAIAQDIIHEKFPEIKSGSVTIEDLAHYYHWESKYKFSGAECNDGWESHSHGRGTCSHHGGIDHYFKEGDYRKTYDECLQIAKYEMMDIHKEAKRISWRD